MRLPPLVEDLGLNHTVPYHTIPPLVEGHDFCMAALSSWSAWSISSMLRMKICRLMRMREKRVDLKWTLPSSSTGMFILTSRL